MSYYICPPAFPLTEEERKNPYAKFYDVPVQTPPAEIMAHFRPGNYMAPEKALRPTEAFRLATAAGIPQDWGFCMLPGGYGYHACRIDMPQVTQEMEAWWSDTHWVAADDVHYKVWLPGFHMKHKGEVLENLGWGVGNVNFKYPLALEQLPGYDPEKVDPALLKVFGCNGFFQRQSDGEVLYNIILNAVRALPEGGITITTIGWEGVHLIDGREQNMLPGSEVANIEYSRLFGCHNAYENYRKAQLLPELYALSKSLS